MNNHKRLTIWTLVANFFIVIAAGHGIGTIGLLQVLAVSSLFGTDDFLSPKEFFQHPLGWLVITNFIGQLFVIVALIKKRSKIYLKLTGLALMLIAFGILLYYLRKEGTVMITYVTGIPFLILSCILAFKHIQGRKMAIEAEEDLDPSTSQNP
jgi:hypothetical protein